MQRETTIGSNHYPIILREGLDIEEEDLNTVQKWSFTAADWEKFRYLSEQGIEELYMRGNVDDVNLWFCRAMLEAAEQSIKKRR